MLGRDEADPALAAVGRRRGRSAACWNGAEARPRCCATSKPLGELQIVANLGDDITEIATWRACRRAACWARSASIRSVSAPSSTPLPRSASPATTRVVGITQGWKLTGAIKTAERKLADGTFEAWRRRSRWPGRWATPKVEPKGNAIAITKQASGSAKIDPLMAAFNAVALMAMNPKPVGRSYLRSGDPAVL